MAHFIFLLPILLGQIQGAGPERGSLVREAWVMGTRLRIQVEGEGVPTSREVTEAALAEVERVDGILSTWNPDSPLSRANRSHPHSAVPLSGELGGLLHEALLWADATGHAFDPGVGALVDAWDLRGEGRLPAHQSLEAARAASGSHLFLLGDGTEPSLTRLAPAAWLDSGGFGKGAGLRAAAATVRLQDTLGPGIPGTPSRGAEKEPTGPPGRRILLDLGGQIWAWGSDADPWPVAIAHPLRRHEPVLGLSIHDVSVATSGTSERWIQVDGTRFGHILDPRSGLPAPAWGSVAVVSRDPMVADILSTALYVMGPEEGLKWVRHQPDVGVLFLQVCQEGLQATWNGAMEEWLTSLPSEGEGFLTQHQSCTTLDHPGGGIS